MKSTAVLVLGMHRSGTSALTGVLGRAGVYLGRDLVAPKEDNPKGYFEHDKIWRVHQEILKGLGSSARDVRNLPVGWQNSEVARRGLDRVRAIVARDFGSAPLWGAKDPRMSRLVPIWREALASLDVEIRVVLAVRHPAEVVASVVSRDPISPATAMFLWLRYSLDAERDSRGLIRSAPHYPDLLTDWRKELARIRESLGLVLPDLAPSTEKTIDEFLDTGLRHHHVSTPWDQSENPIQRLCGEAYQALRDPDSPDSRRVLDAIDAQTRSLEQLALPYVTQIGDYIAQLNIREAQLDRLYRNPAIRCARFVWRSTAFLRKTIPSGVPGPDQEINKTEDWSR